MFRIGEFSKLTQVTIRMLRYYDQVGLLKPEQIDSWTGYRMYSVDQIPILNKITYLRDSGFQVAEIAAAINNENNDVIANMLDKKYKEIVQNIKAEQKKLSKIELAQKHLLDRKDQMHYQIVIKSIPSYQVLSLRKKVTDYFAEGSMWMELSSFASEQKITICGNSFSLYHDTEYKLKDVDVEVCVPVVNMGTNSGNFTFREIPPEPIMASTMVYGPFTNIAGAYLSLADWLQKNSQFQMTTPDRQIVHRGPWNEENQEKYLVEIQIPLCNHT